MTCLEKIEQCVLFQGTQGCGHLLSLTNSNCAVLLISSLIARAQDTRQLRSNNKNFATGKTLGHIPAEAMLLHIWQSLKAGVQSDDFQ